MSGHSSPHLDRPEPGHYQRRLSATFSRLPAQLLPPRRRSVRPQADRCASIRHSDAGLAPARQLALPLESAW